MSAEQANVIPFPAEPCPHCGKPIVRSREKAAPVEPVCIPEGDGINVKFAAWLYEAESGNPVDDYTIIRWCRKFGIGTQLAKGHPWNVSRAAIRMLAADDRRALAAYREGDTISDLVRHYFEA